MFCTCASNTSILEGTNGSHKFRHPSLQTRRRLQPRHLDMVRCQVFLTMSCCLPRPETCRLMRPHFFGATAFTFRFRLECFAVYASSPLLPPGTQDSLRSGAGFTFYDGTFTRKIDATSCRTRDSDEKDHLLYIFRAVENSVLKKSFKRKNYEHIVW